MLPHRKILGILIALALAGPLCCCQQALCAVAADEAPGHRCCSTSPDAAPVPAPSDCETCGVELVRSAEAGSAIPIVPQWLEIAFFAAPFVPGPVRALLSSAVRMPDPATHAPPPRPYLVQRRLLI